MGNDFVATLNKVTQIPRAGDNMYIGRMAERVLCKYNLVVLIIFGNRWYKMLPEGGIRRAVSEFKNLQVCVQPCWIHGCISDRYSKQP